MQRLSPSRIVKHTQEVIIPGFRAPLVALAIIALVLYPSGFCLAQNLGRVVNAVVAGMTCKQTNQALASPRLDCDYRVGNDLHFQILGVGQPDATVKVLRADSKGDYYLSVGGLHTCVVVEEGDKTYGPRTAPARFPQFAFVSPKNGKVYSDWSTCDRAA